MATIVLVHGAWHGGWCWRDVAERLRVRGHGVTTPTLSGLGERAHLLSDRIDLATCIDDIEQHVRFEDLDHIVLVGHSFAGGVITGVADRIGGRNGGRNEGRIGRLIYLDAVIQRLGETAMSQVPESVAAERLRLARESPGGLTMPPPPASAFGVFDPGQAAWVEDRLTPHPIKTYLSALQLRGPVGNGLPAAYVVCTDPVYPGLAEAHARAGQTGWPIHELRAGHDAMVIAPAATAELIDAIAAG
jgi:pimeloyl-ACP methyl ester carboxylesterase